LTAAARAVGLLVPVAGLSGYRALKPPPAPPAEPELPKELTARADVFGRAWAANDQRTLRRLAPPGDERSVYPWYQRHSPPPALRDGAAEARVEISAKAVRPGLSAVRLRVSSPRAPAQAPADLTINWQQRGDTWYFVPGR
jgi:hypothetical protein